MLYMCRIQSIFNGQLVAKYKFRSLYNYDDTEYDVMNRHNNQTMNALQHTQCDSFKAVVPAVMATCAQNKHSNILHGYENTLVET